MIFPDTTFQKSAKQNHCQCIGLNINRRICVLEVCKTGSLPMVKINRLCKNKNFIDTARKSESCQVQQIMNPNRPSDRAGRWSARRRRSICHGRRECERAPCRQCPWGLPTGRFPRCIQGRWPSDNRRQSRPKPEANRAIRTIR